MGTLKQAVDRVAVAKTAIGNAITAKGGTVAAGDGLEEFAGDIATITNQYTQTDEGKVVSGGELVAQTAYPSEITANNTYDTTNYNSVTVNVDTSGSGLVLSTASCKPSTTKFKSENWVSKTWSGLTDFNGQYIWTDGENIYYSNRTTQYVLDKSTSTWSTKTWGGLTDFNGDRIWTDGDNIYISNNYSDYGTIGNYVLNKSTSTWNTKTWSGLTDLNGQYIWTDGDYIYYSAGSFQYVLDKNTSTWSIKTWIGLNSFYVYYIWTDGENIYYSNNSYQYVLDKETSTWSTKTWGQSISEGRYVWTDGDNIYHSYNRGSSYNYSNTYVLDKTNSTWNTKVWSGLNSFHGYYIWTDGENIYYSNGSNQYVLDKEVYNASISMHTPSART